MDTLTEKMTGIIPEEKEMLKELITKVPWPAGLTPESITPIVQQGVGFLKEHHLIPGSIDTAFAGLKTPTIGVVIEMAGRLSGLVGKMGPTGMEGSLKGADKLQTVLGLVDVLLSVVGRLVPSLADEMEVLKKVAGDVLPASLSFAVSVAKGKLDLGLVLRKPEGVSHVEHGRSLFRRFVGLLRRLTPALALCGAGGAAAAAVAEMEKIEEAPRTALKKVVSAVPDSVKDVISATGVDVGSMVEQVAETVGMSLASQAPVASLVPLDIQSEKEPVAPPPTPRISLEEPLPKEEVPPLNLEPAAEEVRSSSPVQPPNDQEPSDQALNSPSVDSRRILHDA
jgi:hypothetical protein